MKTDVITLDGKKAGDIELDKAIFGLDARPDILHRVVNWQLAHRRQGTHAVKFRSDITGTTAKMYRQKGTGRARHGSGKANIFIGGGRAFGPISRSHAQKLPKKVRKLGLKTALSVKTDAGELKIVDSLGGDKVKTKDICKKLEKLGVGSVLFITAGDGHDSFARAIRNIPNVDVIKSEGANVYDILRHDILVVTKDAVKELEGRLK